MIAGTAITPGHPLEFSSKIEEKRWCADCTRRGMTRPDCRFVYVLRSEGTVPHYYVGLTGDPSLRVAAHNQGHASHTSKRGRWRLHVVMEFAGVDVAARFERYLKTGSGRAFAKRHFESREEQPSTLARTPWRLG